MTFLLALFWRGVEELSLRKMQAKSQAFVGRARSGSACRSRFGCQLQVLVSKLNLLTEALQKAENHSLAQEEEIIEKERSGLLEICMIQSVRSCLRLTVILRVSVSRL